MANVLVYIELHGGRPFEGSLEALGEGRRLASTLGATLDALVTAGELPEVSESGEDELISALSRGGADRIVIVTAPTLAGPLMHATHGDAIASTCEAERPILVMFAATAGARDVAPRLAAHMGAAFVPEPSFEYGSRAELVLSRPVYGSLFRRRLSVDDLERPVVATLTPGAYQPEQGLDDAEVVLLAPPAATDWPLEEIERRPDPGSPLDTAGIVVCGGAGMGGMRGWELVCELASALGGEPAATAEACRLGYAPADRAIGVGARRIAPRLYVACGASGAPGHMVGLPGDTEIIAVNSDPAAPIFRVAQYGLVGDLTKLLPELIAAVRGGRGLLKRMATRP